MDSGGQRPFHGQCLDHPSVGSSCPTIPKGKATPEQKAAHEAAMQKWKLEKEEFEKASAAEWGKWRPKFSDYAVVVSNYNGEPWPEEVRNDFVQYIRNGGGLISVHAADNSFPQWLEYNQMIGVGGWAAATRRTAP